MSWHVLENKGELMEKSQKKKNGKKSIKWLVFPLTGMSFYIFKCKRLQHMKVHLQNFQFFIFAA